MKTYRYAARRSVAVSTTTSHEEKRKPLSGKSFGWFTRRKSENQTAERRSPTITRADETEDVTEERDINTTGDILDNDEVVSVMQQIDVLVGSLMTNKSNVTEMKTQTKIEQPADKNPSVTSLGRARSKRSRLTKSRRLQKCSDTKASHTQHDYAPYNFQCFNCSEMFESITNNLASSELTCIHKGEMSDIPKQLFDDSSDMSRLTDITTSLATDLIILHRSNAIYADNYRARKMGRRGFNMSVSNGSNLSFWEIGQQADGIAVESLVRDDISLSFVGRIESLHEC